MPRQRSPLCKPNMCSTVRMQPLSRNAVAPWFQAHEIVGAILRQIALRHTLLRDHERRGDVMAPSTEWREVIDGDEEQRFAAYAEKLAALQKAKSQRVGNGRALHRKQVLGLRATLDVLPDLPAHAAQGLFAQPKHYDVQI